MNLIRIRQFYIEPSERGFSVYRFETESCVEQLGECADLKEAILLMLDEARLDVENGNWGITDFPVSRQLEDYRLRAQQKATLRAKFTLSVRPEK